MIEVGDFIRQPDNVALTGGGNFIGVTCDAVFDLKGQIQSLSLLFQVMHHPDALQVMLEAIGTDLIQNGFSGMTEGRMPQVMPQGNGFRQILIQTKRSGDGAGNLSDLQGVGQPGSVMIPHRGEKHLCFSLESPEGVTVEDPIPVTLKFRPVGAFGLRAAAFGVSHAGACVGA